MNMQVFCSFHWTTAMLFKRWQHYAHTGWPKKLANWHTLFCTS